MTARRLLRWLIPAGLILGAILLIRGLQDDGTIELDGLTYAGPELARALEMASDQPGIRVVRSFTGSVGEPCRAFVGADLSGIACRTDAGWHLRVSRDGISLDDPAAAARTEQALLRSAARMEAQ